MNSQNLLLNNLLEETHTISNIQNYIKKILKIRGFSNETVSDKLLLLIEEVGELAKAIRKFEGKILIDNKRIENYTSVSDEIADVFIILLSICNILDMDLFEIFVEKERVNIQRIWSKQNGN